MNGVVWEEGQGLKGLSKLSHRREGVRMSDVCKNPYKSSREREGFTRLTAVDLISQYYPISERTLSAIENEGKDPDGRLVVAMMIVYQDYELAFEHLDQDVVYSILFPKHERKTALENAARMQLATKAANDLCDETLKRALTDDFGENDFSEKVKRTFDESFGSWKGIIAKTAQVGITGGSLALAFFG